MLKKEGTTEQRTTEQDPIMLYITKKHQKEAQSRALQSNTPSYSPCHTNTGARDTPSASLQSVSHHQ